MNLLIKNNHTLIFQVASKIINLIKVFIISITNKILSKKSYKHVYHNSYKSIANYF